MEIKDLKGHTIEFDVKNIELLSKEMFEIKYEGKIGNPSEAYKLLVAESKNLKEKDQEKDQEQKSNIDRAEKEKSNAKSKKMAEAKKVHESKGVNKA